MIFKKLWPFFLIFSLLFVSSPLLAEELDSDLRVDYAVHVQNIGWSATRF